MKTSFEVEGSISFSELANFLISKLVIVSNRRFCVQKKS